PDAGGNDRGVSGERTVFSTNAVQPRALEFETDRSLTLDATTLAAECFSKTAHEAKRIDRITVVADEHALDVFPREIGLKLPQFIRIELIPNNAIVAAQRPRRGFLPPLFLGTVHE